MPVWLFRILRRVPWRRIPWQTLWAAALWAFNKGRERLEANLNQRERTELRNLMTKSRGRRSNLTTRDEERFRKLVRKALTGSAS